MTMQTDYLIVGVGNTLRCDDGAGWVLANHLAMSLTSRGANVQLLLVQQLLPELAAEIAELSPTTLVVADCTTQMEQSPLQRVKRTTPDAMRSHGMTPEQLIAITDRLYEFSGSAWLATVPGHIFAHGEGLSMATQQAITTTVPAMVAELLLAR